MRKFLALFTLLALSIVSPAFADWTGKDASGSTITFKNADDCTSVVCVPVAALVNAAGATLYGTAGTANAGVLSIQGIASMTPVGISIASGGAAAGALAAGAGVDGWDLTQGAKADAVCPTATGTCSSIALLKFLNTNVASPPPLNVNGSNTAWTGLTPGVAQTGTIIAANMDLSSVAGIALGAMANYGTSPGAVKVQGVNAFVTNTVTVTGAGGTFPATLNTTPSLANGNGVVLTQGGAVLSATNGGFQNVLQGNAVLSATNGLYANLLQGNAVLSATNGLYANLMVGNAAVATGTGAIGSTVPRFGVATDQATNAGAALVKGGVGTVNGGSDYETVAASQTAQALGATGATGDYLSHCVLQPTTTGAGTMTILDNATVIFTFTTGTLSNLVPIAIPIGALSVSGAWKVTTGANESVTCFGKFT